MKIAIDESGDTGRKIWKGASRWFVLSAVIVPEVADGCGQTCQYVSRYAHEHMYGQEIHFAHNSHQQHLKFFEYMQGTEYIHASVAIDKRKLLKRRPQILVSKMSVVQYAFDQLFSQIQPWLDDPLVLIDTNGQDWFNRALSRHLLNEFGPTLKGDLHAIKNVKAVDSRREPLVQLADYVAGAVRHYVDDQYPSESFETYLADKGKIYFA
jgi:Protein of unknown function (DUF3800)